LRAIEMAIVVFLRGVNVGGHRRFRPTELARTLHRFDVVNVGATGTFVVRKPGSRTAFRSELRRNLPFETVIALCEGRDILRWVLQDPFAAVPPRPGTVRFVSVLANAPRTRPDLPVALPSRRGWRVQVIASEGRFVWGIYRRHMKTIGCLGQLDRMFDVPVTTRNWNTMLAVTRILDMPAKA
jgi:uncharacterized protein (DUF1697 family)